MKNFPKKLVITRLKKEYYSDSIRDEGGALVIPIDSVLWSKKKKSVLKNLASASPYCSILSESKNSKTIEDIVDIMEIENEGLSLTFPRTMGDYFWYGVYRFNNLSCTKLTLSWKGMDSKFPVSIQIPLFRLIKKLTEIRDMEDGLLGNNFVLDSEGYFWRDTEDGVRESLKDGQSLLGSKNLTKLIPGHVYLEAETRSRYVYLGRLERLVKPYQWVSRSTLCTLISNSSLITETYLDYSPQIFVQLGESMSSNIGNTTFDLEEFLIGGEIFKSGQRPNSLYFWSSPNNKKILGIDEGVLIKDIPSVGESSFLKETLSRCALREFSEYLLGLIDFTSGDVTDNIREIIRKRVRAALKDTLDYVTRSGSNYFSSLKPGDKKSDYFINSLLTANYYVGSYRTEIVSILSKGVLGGDNVMKAEEVIDYIKEYFGEK